MSELKKPEQSSIPGDLPNELFAKILKSITDPKDIDNLMGVNKKVAKLTDDFAWKNFSKIDISGRWNTTESASKQVESCKIDVIVIYRPPHCPPLRTIRLRRVSTLAEKLTGEINNVKLQNSSKNLSFRTSECQCRAANLSPRIR